jgi:hypothetical protein
MQKHFYAGPAAERKHSGTISSNRFYLGSMPV